MKKILVTGSAGFIGTNLCEELLKRGHTVIGVDNYYTGQESNTDYLLSKYFHRFSFLSLDVINFNRYLDIIDFENVNEIYSLASPASPPKYQKDPVYTIETNINGSLNMLDFAKKCNAKVLLASTSEVYGDPDIHPQPEKYNGNVNPIGIRACYDESKRVSESLFFSHNRLYGTEIAVVRIFNTYGMHMDIDDGRVITNFIKYALKGEKLPIYGDGTQTRSFQFITDLVAGLIGVMEDTTLQGPFNIGNPNELTILELSGLVQEMIPECGGVEYFDLPEDDPLQRCPNIDLITNTINWKPEVSLKEGLKKTIDYFKTIYKKLD